jgi:heptose I phosphotransferase
MASLWQRLARGVKRLRQLPEWTRFASPDWPDHIMSLPVTDQFHAKQGRTTGRCVMRHRDQNLVVYLKRHYRLPAWRGVLATLFPRAGWSPALQEWQSLERAHALGFPVPRAVAAAEYIGPWCRLRSFLAVEELTDMLPLHEAIPAAKRHFTPIAFEGWKRGLTAELARVTSQLHSGCYFHKDLYLCHFFIPRRLIDEGGDWRGQVHFIDLHRFRRHPILWRRWLIKDLAQLLYSSDIDGIELRDRLRFWSAYRKEARLRSETALFRALVVWKYRRYRRHNTRAA